MPEVSGRVSSGACPTDTSIAKQPMRTQRLNLTYICSALSVASALMGSATDGSSNGPPPGVCATGVPGRKAEQNSIPSAWGAVPRTPFRFLRAASLRRFGLRGTVVACPVLLAVCVSMHPANAYPGSARDMTVTAGPALMDVS